MLKKWFVLLVVVLTSAVQAEVLVGIVDIQSVLTSIKDGKEVNSKLEKIFNKKKLELTSTEDKIKKLQEAFKKKSMVMSAAAKAKEEKKIQDEYMAYQQLRMKAQQDMQKEEQALKAPILEKLKPVIESISKKEKVALTFEISSSPVIYAAKQVNLTPMVIEAYDKQNK